MPQRWKRAGHPIVPGYTFIFDGVQADQKFLYEAFLLQRGLLNNFAVPCQPATAAHAL